MTRKISETKRNRTILIPKWNKDKNESKFSIVLNGVQSDLLKEFRKYCRLVNKVPGHVLIDCMKVIVINMKKRELKGELKKTYELSKRKSRKSS